MQGTASVSGKKLRCVTIRKQVCYAFVDVDISEDAARELLPENGVPQVFVDESLQMQEAKFSEPSLDGPAKVRDPSAKEEDVASDVEEEVTACDEGDDSEIVTCEEIIGLDEAHVDDPLSQLVVLQSRIKSLQKRGISLSRGSCDAQLKSEASVGDDVAVNAGVEQRRQHFVEMQAVIRKMTGGNLDA